MEVSLSKITSVHTDILPPYPLHHNILRPSKQGFISRWHWHQSVEKHFSFSCGKCPFPLSASWPCSEKAGQGHRHDSISRILNACLFPNIRPVNGSKLSPRWCHRCWRPPTWSLGPSGPSGVLPSPADQAHRRAQGSEAAKFSCFPHPTVALPYPAYVPARRPPPLPSSLADPLNLFSRFLPTYFISDQCQKQLAGSLNILFFSYFFIHLLPLPRKK